MHSTFGKRTLGWAGLLALVAVLLAPSPAGAVPEPGAKGRGFRLFARALGAITVNRIYCGLNSAGEVCVDSLGSSTIGGGFWPKGTADQYIFNSGLQLAGIVSGGPWDGDTTGAFFFDPKGTTVHGNEVTPIYNSQNPADAAAWPAEARVPSTGPSSNFYDDLLKGRIAASQGDIWYLTWEGDPGLNAGRPHPLGILAEVRGFGWNYPRGNEDILYFVYSFYNVTSLNAADYATARPELQPILLAQAQAFHTRNNAAFGITLPAGGYTISNLFAAFSRDDDVADAGANYSSVNLPFALGYTYEHTFYGPNQVADLGWTFPDAIFSAPFFKGPGFTGAKYLASPTGAGEIQLFSNTINGGDFNDAQNTTQLFRYLSGNISIAAGDEPCSYVPAVDRICYVNNTGEDDMRFFQSSTPLTLGPGESGSIVVAYIHAAPVALPSFTGGPSADIKPGDPRGLGDPLEMSTQINQIDSLSGYLDFSDANGDGEVTQDEFNVVPGSLLGKAKVAQTIFDTKFLLPFSPEVPPFFLVPGDNEVTVFWQPSPTDDDLVGDPFYDLAKDALKPDLTVNPLYDANYRKNDVEGYRVYRGRVDNPEELQLIGTFDKDGTLFSDFYGTVNATGRCAPEILEGGVPVEDDCAVDFDDVLTPGIQLAAHADYPINSPLVQNTARVLLADGSVLQTANDTAVTGGASGFPGMTDTGIPFVYVDRDVRNGFRYFYAVTAFDVNSIRSGPSSLESSRTTKSATPTKDAANYSLSGTVTGLDMLGRGTALTPTAPFPTIDAETGTFSGPMPPARTWTLGFADFVARVLSEPGNFTVTLDSVGLGDSWAGIPARYFFSLETGAQFTMTVQQGTTTEIGSGAVQFSAVAVDPDLAALYGGSADYALQGKITTQHPGNYYMGNYGRGCVNGAAGYTAAGAGNCAYNGPRWFDGASPTANETVAHPQRGNTPNFSGTPMTDYNNGGFLTGVDHIFQAQSYQAAENVYREIEGVLAGAKRSADYALYWGAGGTIDSIIDVTHNVVVPFHATNLGSTWGVLNQSAAQPFAGAYDRRTELTTQDFGCIEPLRSLPSTANRMTCTEAPYVLSQTVVPGPVVFWSPTRTASRTAAPAANNGFALYLSGTMWAFELTGGTVPAAGTVWSMRDYIGAISGGGCATCGAGDYGDYTFTPNARQPLTAAGVQLRVSYEVTNQLEVASNRDLSNVHTVPDPYYVTNEYEQTTDTKIIKFVNLPQEAIIRIYSASGVLVRVIEHQSSIFGGEATWNVRNRNNQVVASGVYFFHIESGEARKVGRFTVVNFAQ
jgi:hypothetical protein